MTRIIACAGIYILKCFQPLQWNESKLLTGTTGECWGAVVLKHTGWLSQALSLTAAEAGSFSPPPITYTAALFAWLPAQSIARTAGDSPARAHCECQSAKQQVGSGGGFGFRQQVSITAGCLQVSAVHHSSGMGRGENAAQPHRVLLFLPRIPSFSLLFSPSWQALRAAHGTEGRLWCQRVTSVPAPAPGGCRVHHEEPVALCSAGATKEVRGELLGKRIKYRSADGEKR